MIGDLQEDRFACPQRCSFLKCAQSRPIVERFVPGKSVQWVHAIVGDDDCDAGAKHLSWVRSRLLNRDEQRGVGGGFPLCFEQVEVPAGDGEPDPRVIKIGVFDSPPDRFCERVVPE